MDQLRDGCIRTLQDMHDEREKDEGSANSGRPNDGPPSPQAPAEAGAGAGEPSAPQRVERTPDSDASDTSAAGEHRFAATPPVSLRGRRVGWVRLERQPPAPPPIEATEPPEPQSAAAGNPTRFGQAPTDSPVRPPQPVADPPSASDANASPSRPATREPGPTEPHAKEAPRQPAGGSPPDRTEVTAPAAAPTPWTERIPRPAALEDLWAPSAIGRLVALVVACGLGWALLVAISIWLIVFFVSRAAG